MTEPPDSLGPPTQVRYRILGIAFLAGILLYLDRFCVTYAQTYIRESIGIDNDQLSWCMSAFFITYALAQVPSGWLTDRFGPRRMFTIYLLAWSLCTGLTGLVGSFLGLLAVRLATGLAQAGAYPACASLVRRWLPYSGRGRGNSFVAFGGRVGGGIAPFLTAFLVIQFVSPEQSMLLTPADILSTQAVQTEGDSSRQSESATDSERDANEGFVQAQRHELLQRLPEAAVRSGSAQELAEALNDLIEGPVLLDAQSLERIKVEQEARTLVDQLEESSSSPPEDVQRVNRFILEALLPMTVRKLYVHGWRPVMWLYGLLGIPVAILFWIIVRDRPRDHPRANAAERLLISGGESAPMVAPKGKLPLLSIPTCPPLILMSVTQFGINIGWAFLVTWLPRYLREAHQVVYAESAWLAGIPLLCGWPGTLAGGWLTDLLTKRMGRRWGRALPIGLTCLVSAVCFAGATVASTPLAAVALFSTVAFMTDAGLGAIWAVNQEVGGRYTASVLGWGNMWGNLGAAASPVVLQSFVGDSAHWNLAFLACSGAFAVSGICGLLIDSRKRLSGASIEDVE